MAIDFSAPAALPAVARYVRQTGTPLLSGVTGLSGAELEIFTEPGPLRAGDPLGQLLPGRGGVPPCPGGVAGLLSDFDVEIVETHHNQKADAPSGTAKLLLEAVDPARAHPGLRPPRRFRSPGQAEIGVHALRAAPRAGTHTVSFFGPDEVLEITHRASHPGRFFVNGALHAAPAADPYAQGPLRPGGYLIWRDKGMMNAQEIIAYIGARRRRRRR